MCKEVVAVAYFMVRIKTVSEPGSSVGIPNEYGLDGPRSNPGED